MYRLGKQTDKHRRGRHIAIAIVLLVFSSVIIYGLMNLRIAPQQEIRNANPVSKGYKSNTEAKVVIDKPLFRLELPSGWREITNNKDSPTAPKFSFRSPSSQAQMLDLYIDYTPVNMAVNRAIAVSAQGDGLAYDNVSENCTTFTDSSLKNPQTGNAPAKWQTTNFICDMANYARAVVGTMSTDGINQVTVTGATAGTRKVFITYTDNNISPNYSTLYEILGSLHFK